jgi:TatA/E family protein of Tat protein translocase
LFGVEDLLLISVIILVVVGPDKLPEVARMLGKAAKEFNKVTYTARRAWNEIGEEIDRQEAQAKAALLTEKLQAQSEAGNRAAAQEGAPDPAVNDMAVMAVQHPEATPAASIPAPETVSVAGMPSRQAVQTDAPEEKLGAVPDEKENSEQ